MQEQRAPLQHMVDHGEILPERQGESHPDKRRFGIIIM
jgi:hypothetical protein